MKKRMILAAAEPGLKAFAFDCETNGQIIAGASANPRVYILAYTGAEMHLVGWPKPVVVDIAGMILPEQVPLLADHNRATEGILGHGQASVVSHQLTIDGQIVPQGEAAERVLRLAKTGFKFQASIGVEPLELKQLRPGETAECNGRTFTAGRDGLTIVTKSKLKEVSILGLGADDQTAVQIAARAASNLEGTTMTFEKWCEEKGHNLASLSEEEKAKLRKEFDDDQAAKETEAKAKADEVKAHAAEAKRIAAAAGDVTANMRANAAAEFVRISAVSKACEKHPELAAKAISDGWTPDKAELEVLRADRVKAPSMRASASVADFPVLEAAAMLASRQFSDAELVRSYGDKTVEAASKRYRGGLGLQELLLEAALINGYSSHTFRDRKAIMQAAFSTAEISGILSNVANKFLLQGFFSVENTWRIIAAVRNVKDFKTVTSYRLTGTEIYQQVAPTGEIKHGTLGEESFTNKADTYGLMLGVTRTDIINDDLGAITTVPRKLGRGAALKLNQVFWAAWLDDAVFFATDDSNKNYISGAATLLGSAGLKAMITKFRRQVDSEGNLLSVEPRIILGPPEVEEPLLSLNASVTVNTGGAATTEKVPNVNIYGGRFIPAISGYLTDITAWYLLANPQDIAAIEVAFLNGQESPTIETADADFNTLGIQMRGYHDFGVSKQDPRAATKSKGK